MAYRCAILGSAAALALCGPVLAQQPQGYLSVPTGAPVYVTPSAPAPTLQETFSSTGSTTLSTSTTTANVALPGAGQYVEVANGGSVTVYVALGVGSGTAATKAGFAIPAGQTVFLETGRLSAGTATYIAGITASSTATLTVTTGTLAPITGSGGSSNVTIVAPLGSVAPAAGVSTTLDTTDAAALQSIVTNTTTGTAGTPATNVVTVQGISGGTAVPVSGTFYPTTQPVSIASGQVVSGALAAGAIVDLGTGATPAANTANNYLQTLAGAVSSSVFQNNIKNWAGTALGAPSNYGTSPGAVEVPGVNAFITNTPAVTCSACATATNQQTPATHAQCSALCTSLVAKASAGTLYSFNVSADSTLSGAAWWLLIYDATSKPTDGSVTPAKCYALPSGSVGINGAFDTGGVAFATGITLAVSTTGCFTSTSSTHAAIAADYE